MTDEIAQYEHNSNKCYALAFREKDIYIYILLLLFIKLLTMKSNQNKRKLESCIFSCNAHLIDFNNRMIIETINRFLQHIPKV